MGSSKFVSGIFFINACQYSYYTFFYDGTTTHFVKKELRYLEFSVGGQSFGPTSVCPKVLSRQKKETEIILEALANTDYYGSLKVVEAFKDLFIFDLSNQSHNLDDLKVDTLYQCLLWTDSFHQFFSCLSSKEELRSNNVRNNDLLSFLIAPEYKLFNHFIRRIVGAYNTAQKGLYPVKKINPSSNTRRYLFLHTMCLYGASDDDTPLLIHIA